jgi:hypothetical protein
MDADEQRRINVTAIAARRRAATHCKHGHEFTPENTYWKSDGCRQCRTCHRDSDYSAKLRKRLDAIIRRNEG